MGWRTSVLGLNEMMPSCFAAFPDNTGWQDPLMIYHWTGIDDDPNVTEHLAMPLTGIGSLLYGLILWVVENIISVSPYHSASLTPHTDTLLIANKEKSEFLLSYVVESFVCCLDEKCLCDTVYALSKPARGTRRTLISKLPQLRWRFKKMASSSNAVEMIWLPSIIIGYIITLTSADFRFFAHFWFMTRKI